MYSETYTVYAATCTVRRTLYMLRAATCTARHTLYMLRAATCTVKHTLYMLGEMHGIVGRAWYYDRWYVYTYH